MHMLRRRPEHRFWTETFFVFCSLALTCWLKGKYKATFFHPPHTHTSTKNIHKTPQLVTTPKSQCDVDDDATLFCCCASNDFPDDVVRPHPPLRRERIDDEITTQRDTHALTNKIVQNMQRWATWPSASKCASNASWPFRRSPPKRNCK